MARPADVSVSREPLTEGNKRTKTVHMTLSRAIHDAPDPRIYFRLPYIPRTNWFT